MQTFGLFGELKSKHKLFSSMCIQFVIAGFPMGIPGIGDEIEGAKQQAPHFLQINFSF
jgi:hypothetical protein